jgi:hypothetical protein
VIRFLSLIILFLPVLVFSQNEFYNTGSAVYIQKGALLHVQGTLTNTVDAVYGATGTFTNNGIIELDGDFSSATGTTFQPDLSAASTDRTVKFTGLGTQYIKGTGAATFYNLVLDKQSATDTVKMQTPVTVTGSVIFNTGNTYSSLYPSGVLSTTYNPSITTGVTNNGLGGLLKTFDGTTGTEYLLDVQNPDVDAINGYPALVVNGNPATAYVVTKGTSGSATGGLQRAIGSATSYVYPIGTTVHGFNATRFNFTSVPGGNQTVKGKFCDYQTSASASYTGTIDVTCIGCWGNYVAPDNLGYNYYFSTDSCTGHPQWFILDGQDIKHGYWTYNSSDNTAFQYSVEMFPNNITGPASLSLETWRVLKYDDGAHTYGYDPSQKDWTSQIRSQITDTNDLMTWSLNTGCYAGPGIPGGVYTGFSEFTLDKSNSDNALPVTLISLEAYPVNNTFIQVQWTTSLEINNSGFRVQRSLDAVNFTDVGWVAGHGNSTDEHTYDYNDYNVTPNIVYYYRLIQVDNNGHQSPTDIVQAMLTGGNVFVISELFPNPASDHSSLNITTSQALMVDIKLYDVIGQQITDKDYNLVSGVNNISFNSQMLAAGTYTVIIDAGGKFYSRKLVITR